MRKTKELGDGKSVTVTFRKNASQEFMSKFMEQAATGCWGTNDLPSGSNTNELLEKNLERIVDNLKVGAFEKAVKTGEV